MTHVQLEYSKITDYIYVGTNMCNNKTCSMHFGKLKKLNIKADIDLESERNEDPHGVETYLWLPTKDNTPSTFLQLNIGVKYIDDLVNAKKRIYVHCKLGHGRSPMLIIAYFIYKGMKFKDAFKFVKKKRPEIHLNKLQLNGLKKFEKSIKKK